MSRHLSSHLDEIYAIAAAAEASDGIAPLDEATLLELANRPVDAVVVDGGFALLIGDELSVVVHPEHRGRGIGRELATSLPGRRAWSHGDHPAAAMIAASLGWRRVRDLWVMRRHATSPLPDLPQGMGLRAFRAGDEAELLRVNAAAFAEHPEQGAMDERNLAERMASPWFRPQDLLIAEDDDGRMLGFHWTKPHDAHLSEVYVVGVDPAAQGRGLGKWLTLAGLQHMAGREVHLYVESDNAPAIAVYTGLGFERTETHVMYADA